MFHLAVVFIEGRLKIVNVLLSLLRSHVYNMFSNLFLHCRGCSIDITFDLAFVFDAGEVLRPSPAPLPAF